MTSTTPRFLLVTRIGPKSLHQNWIGTPKTRQFDVFLSAYTGDAEEVQQEGVRNELRPGFKVEGYGGFINAHRALWERYDYICFWDEDLDTDTDTLNRMFAICAEARFKIAQPALSHDSHFTYAGLLQQKGFRYRHINYIEMMCPIFRTDALPAVETLYHSGYESGIDLIWCNLLFETPCDFAVIDDTPVRHTEAVGQRKEDNGFSTETRYEDHIHSLLNQYDLPWLSCNPYSGICNSGRIVSSRMQLFLAALGAFKSVTKQRPYWPRLRFVLVHLKHIAEARPQNLKRNLSQPLAGPLPECSET